MLTHTHTHTYTHTLARDLSAWEVASLDLIPDESSNVLFYSHHTHTHTHTQREREREREGERCNVQRHHIWPSIYMSISPTSKRYTRLWLVRKAVCVCVLHVNSSGNLTVTWPRSHTGGDLMNGWSNYKRSDCVWLCDSVWLPVWLYIAVCHYMWVPIWLSMWVTDCIWFWHQVRLGDRVWICVLVLYDCIVGCLYNYEGCVAVYG